MILGDAVSKFSKDVCMDFEPYFKVYNLVSVHPKSIILSQMINLNMIVHVVVSVYRFVKISNSPEFPAEFRNGQFCFLCITINSVSLVEISNLVPFFKKRHSFVAIIVYEAFAIALTRICEATNFVLNKGSRNPSTPLN